MIPASCLPPPASCSCLLPPASCSCLLLLPPAPASCSCLLLLPPASWLPPPASCSCLCNLWIVSGSLQVGGPRNEFVANTSHSHKMSRFGWFVLDVFSEAHNKIIDCPGVCIFTKVP